MSIHAIYSYCYAYSQCKIPIKALLTSYRYIETYADPMEMSIAYVGYEYEGELYTKKVKYGAELLRKVNVGEYCTVYIDANNKYVAAKLFNF